jgi:multiple sugar transport system permease protein
VTRTLPASVAPTRPAPPARRRWSRERVETLVFGVLRWAVIAVLVVATLLPMYYMVVLSLRSLDEVVLRPALLWPAEFDWSTYVQVLVSEEEGGQGFPAILLAVPLFVFFSAIGLRGSLVGLVVVYVAQTVPLSIYMPRDYFETVAVSLE